MRNGISNIIDRLDYNQLMNQYLKKKKMQI